MSKPPSLSSPFLITPDVHHAKENNAPTHHAAGAGNGSSSDAGANSWWKRHVGARNAPPQSRPDEEPHEALETAIVSWTAKATWNKKAAQRGTRAIILSSAGIPVALLVSTELEGFLIGKAVPAILAAIAVAAAGRLQFNRPYEEWKLFRGCQRSAEHERLLYYNRLHPYDDPCDKRNADQLARTLIHLECRLQAKWAALLPRDSEVGGRVPNLR